MKDGLPVLCGELATCHNSERHIAHAPDDASCTKPGLQLGLDQVHFGGCQMIIYACNEEIDELTVVITKSTDDKSEVNKKGRVELTKILMKKNA